MSFCMELEKAKLFAPGHKCMILAMIRHLLSSELQMCRKNWYPVQPNFGSRTPRIMNNSVYEQIFRTQSVSDDVLCLELRTRKPSTSLER